MKIPEFLRMPSFWVSLVSAAFVIAHGAGVTLSSGEEYALIAGIGSAFAIAHAVATSGSNANKATKP